MPMMAQLYAHDALPWDRVAARNALVALLEAPQHGTAWLMEADREPAGYLVITIGFSLEFHGRYGLLDEFFVEPQRRSHGIGSAALAFADEQCRSWGLDALRLEADVHNSRALELYRRRGFRAHDRYLMTRWIDRSC